MHIVENTTERLVLKGIPGSIIWMGFCTLLGVAFMAVCACFAWVTVREGFGYLQLIPLGIGFVMGLAFFLIGLVTLSVGRMRLTLDRVTGNGAYEVYSPIVDVGKPCSFRLDDIDSVTIERREEARPDSGEHGSFPAKVCRARLRVRKPRRVIVLDETENGREQRVQSAASSVAGWLGIDVT